MLQIRATDLDADLEGSLEDLQHIRTEILHLLASSEVRLDIQARAVGDPTPYLRMLSQVRIERSVGPMRVVLLDDVLLLSGSDESLDRFASWFDFSGAVAPTHKHHEYFPGNEFIAVDSVPLVISARAQQALGGDSRKPARASS